MVWEMANFNKIDKLRCLSCDWQAKFTEALLEELLILQDDGPARTLHCPQCQSTSFAIYKTPKRKDNEEG